MRMLASRLTWTLFTLLLSWSIATRSTAAVVSSAHNFTASRESTTGGCTVCHMQPGFGADPPAQPLWSGGLRDTGKQPAVFLLSREAAQRSRRYGQWPVTKSCVSCHDGSVADHDTSRMGRAESGSSWQAFSSVFALGNTHPVALVYDAESARRTPGLADPSVTPSGLGRTIADDLLVDSRVECSSCHTVHDRAGDGRFLRMANTRGELCLTCHNL